MDGSNLRPLAPKTAYVTKCPNRSIFVKVKTSSLHSPVECFCEAGVMGGVGIGLREWKRGFFLGPVFFFFCFIFKRRLRFCCAPQLRVFDLNYMDRLILFATNALNAIVLFIVADTTLNMSVS